MPVSLLLTVISTGNYPGSVVALRQANCTQFPGRLIALGLSCADDGQSLCLHTRCQIVIRANPSPGPGIACNISFQRPIWGRDAEPTQKVNAKTLHIRLALTTLPWKQNPVLFCGPLSVVEYRMIMKAMHPEKQDPTKSTFRIWARSACFVIFLKISLMLFYLGV
jgi:hypothetical protein